MLTGYKDISVVTSIVNVYDYRYRVNVETNYHSTASVEFLSCHKTRKEFLQAIRACVADTLSDVTLCEKFKQEGKSSFDWADFFCYVSDATRAKYGLKMCETKAIVVTCRMHDSICTLLE